MSVTAERQGVGDEFPESGAFDTERSLFDSMLDAAAQRFEERWPEAAGYLETYHPNQKEKRLTDIDVHALIEQGIDTLFIDAEGTLLGYDGWKVGEAEREWLAKAREAGIKNIILVTNKRIKSKADMWQVEMWAEQADVDAVFTAQADDERKPSPKNLLKAMQHFGFHERQSAGIGDKYTDMVAYNLFGSHSILLTGPYAVGDHDHIGDRTISRPAHNALGAYLETRPRRGDRQFRTAEEAKIEAMALLAVISGLDIQELEDGGVSDDVILMMGEALLDSARFLEDVEIPLRQEAARQAVRDSGTVPPYIFEKGLIAGFGGPQIDQLDFENRFRMPPPLFQGVRDMHNELKRQAAALVPEAAEPVIQEARQRAAVVAKRHGRNIADALTLSRIPLSMLAARAIRSDHPLAAAGIQMLTMATDAEGKLIANKPDDDSERRKAIGKQLDRWIDKAAAYKIGRALVATMRKSGLHQNVQTVREVARVPEVWMGEGIGLNTGSDVLTKHGTVHEGLANILSTLLGKRHPALSFALQSEVSGVKVFSIYHSWQVWRYRQANGMMAQIAEYRLTEGSDNFRMHDTDIDRLTADYEQFMNTSDFALLVDAAQTLGRQAVGRFGK